MKLDLVMDEIGDALDDIPGLNVYRFPVDSLTPPAAVVQFPTINYDGAFQRGLDRMEGGVAVAVSRVWDRAARDAIARYCAGDGAESVHAALHGHDWQTCAFARVVRVAFPPAYVVGGTDFVAAQFTLDIAGTG